MRTFTYSHAVKLKGATITVSTEVIVGDDEEIEQAGIDASDAMSRFIDGMGKTKTPDE